MKPLSLTWQVVAATFARSLLVVRSCFLLTLVATVPVQADSNFNVELITSYHVDDQALSTVEHQFTITNLTPAYFINRYGLKLNSKGIKNVEVLFDNKPINAEHPNTCKVVWRLFLAHTSLSNALVYSSWV